MGTGTGGGMGPGEGGGYGPGRGGNIGGGDRNDGGGGPGAAVAVVLTITRSSVGKDVNFESARSFQAGAAVH